MSDIPADLLRLDAMTRTELWNLVGEAIEAYYRDASQLSATSPVSADEVRHSLAQFDFDRRLSPSDAVLRVIEALRRLQPNVSHPRYFGLFDPAPTAVGVLADAIAAAFNPCLASSEGSPFGVEAERVLVKQFGQLFGYPEISVDGIFSSGGSEANLMAVMMALTEQFPKHKEFGLRKLPCAPIIYMTQAAHPSLRKAVFLTGLGYAAIRQVPVDLNGHMNVNALESLMDADTAAGLQPFMIIVTAGTTGAGIIDPIDEVANVAAKRRLWLHVDAAWGGAIMLLPEMRDELRGIHRADSITFDPHKWLSIPKSCGLLLTRHPDLLGRTFGVPADFLAGNEEVVNEPFARSIHWSRGFSGLKLLLSLAVAGWQGYQDAIRHQVMLGRRLREALNKDGWTLVNHTPLPVVCFTEDSYKKGTYPKFLDLVANTVNLSGEARIFVVRIEGRYVLRACITNYATTTADVDVLVRLLAKARTDVIAGWLD